MEHNRHCVLIDPLADQKLAGHVEFLARVSEKAAINLYEAYQKALEFIENSPEGCPPYFTSIPIDEKLRYKLFYRRYRIVFEIIGNDVYVYDIQDCRQNNDANLI